MYNACDSPKADRGIEEFKRFFTNDDDDSLVDEESVSVEAYPGSSGIGEPNPNEPSGLSVAQVRQTQMRATGCDLASSHTDPGFTQWQAGVSGIVPWHPESVFVFLFFFFGSTGGEDTVRFTVFFEDSTPVLPDDIIDEYEDEFDAGVAGGDDME